MEDIIIKLENVNKIYKMYESPKDRFKEALNWKNKKYHKDFYAIKNLSLEIKKGEIIGFLGKNGAGKSTLLKLITGVLTPNDGMLNVNGRISALIELGAGFNPEYTGIQNIYLYGTLQGKSKEEMDKELEEIITFADIGDFIYQPVKNYSSGMFARLAFSVAINVKPDILIVDEILSVGDTMFQLKSMKKMKDLMEGGTTVIFVSHDMNTIKTLCTRAIWLENGTLKLDGNVHQVTDKYLEGTKEKKEIEKKNTQFNFVPKEGKVGEIKEFRIEDRLGNEKSIFREDEKLRINVVYHIYKKVDNPVLGIALKNFEDEYICGINTLLDKHAIPNEIGENRIILEYTQGLLCNSGSYYFDIALFDETAMVHFDYIKKIKEIEIQMPYKGIGHYIVPHTWENIGREYGEI